MRKLIARILGLYRLTILNRDPVEKDLAKNTFGIFKNSVTGTVSIYVNDNGKIKSFISSN